MSTPARTLMVQGTASGVGKSWMVAGLCRLLHRKGFRVAPFKAQNMSNNAAVTPSGGEVGRAQAVQAMAAGVEIDERMNPVLLKPLGDTRSEVVVMGRSRPELTRLAWTERKARLWPFVTDALDRLRSDFDWVVMEGAGSPAEINLREGDIVNMAVARYAGSPVLLVADIDRGGAFASLLGTWRLLSPAERRHVRGFVLNRFRGDPTLLGSAPGELERRTGVGVLGVVPWVHARLPEEDAAVLERRGASPTGPTEGAVAVVRFPRLANFDDVLPLEEDGVGIRWVEDPQELAGARAVILPGTRNTAGDLAWLRRQGLESALRRMVERGVPVLGICGGFQMLGEEVSDPHGVENEERNAPGLGLLPIRTEMAPAKDVRRVRARWGGGGARGTLDGYQIRHGRSQLLGDAEVLMRDDNGREEVLGLGRGTVWGTYVHGCLEDDAFRRAWLATVGVSGDGGWAGTAGALDAVADALEEALDMEALLKLEGPSRREGP